MRSHVRSYREPDAEHRAREGFDPLALDLDPLVLDYRPTPCRVRALRAFTDHATFTMRSTQGRKPPRGAGYCSRLALSVATPTRGVRMRGPSPWIATVCSKCAAREPSVVEMVQPSPASQTSGPPTVIIGSIAIVIPSESLGPRPGWPKFGTCGSSW